MKKNNIGYLLVILAGLVWGTIGIGALNLSNLKLNSYEIAFIRTSFAFVIGSLYLFLNFRKQKTNNRFLSKNVIIQIILSGIICQGVLNIFYSNSVTRVGTITSIMLMATGPLFTLIFSKIFFKEYLGISKIISLIITFIGAFILITEGNIEILKFNSIGIVSGILSGVCYGLFPIFNTRILKEIDPIIATVYGFGVASVFLLFFIDLGFIKVFLTDMSIIKGGIFYALVATLIPYMLYSKSMEYISSTTASILSLLEVPSTTFVGILFLNENLTLVKSIGIVIVFLGILISKIQRK